MKIVNITKVALLALSSLMLMPAQADYPDKPIGVMVAYGPGGATDFQARIATLASGKEELIGQPIYILNKPGAGGRKGWNWFASEASQDGYMLGAYNVPHFIAQSIVFDTKYNINNLEPLGNWGADPAVLRRGPAWAPGHPGSAGRPRRPGDDPVAHGAVLPAWRAARRGGPSPGKKA